MTAHMSSGATVPALLLAAVMGGTDLAAQEPATTSATPANNTPSADTSQPKWAVSLGTNISNLSIGRGAGVRADFLGALSREWQTSGPQLAFRTELMLGGTRLAGGTFYRQFGSISEMAKYSFRSGTFRPYLIAGPGIYFERLTYSYVACFQVGYCTPSQIPIGYNPATRWSLGLSGGAGFDMKLGRSRLFLEQRLTMPGALSDWGNGEFKLPLSFGIRF